MPSRVHTWRRCGRAASAAALLLLATACTYTAAVTQTNVPADRSRPVKAEVKKYIVLGFNFSNDQVFTLTKKLAEQCPDGVVKGVLTQDQWTEYVLIFFWARETTATGYCVRGGKRTAGVDAADEVGPAYAESDAGVVP